MTLKLPAGYYLEQNPDACVLRRSDGRMVAAFSAPCVAPEAIRRAAEDDAGGASLARVALRVSFFGNFEVARNGEALPLGRNTKAVAILKCLLAHRDRPASRDHLMGWLWPESNLHRARLSLNSAVRALRKLLNEHADSPGVPATCVVLEEGRYRFGPEIEVSTDVENFDAHRERGRRLDEQRRASEAVTEYEEAAALYRDDYLVEDLYEDWTMVERERLLSAYTETLCRLADLYEGMGKDWEAIGASLGLLEKDPCCERAYRLLMGCYARLGLPTLAERQYALCKDVLHRRLRVAPSSQTQAMNNSILGKEAATGRASPSAVRA